jgi:glycine/D-amino acid oxidase-like deaminating enzyme
MKGWAMGSVSYWQTEAGAAEPYPLRERMSADVTIIGAGITGVALALWLARAGLRPVVLEARQIAAGASGRNGGFLLGGTAEAYATTRERYGAERARRIWAYSAANNAMAVELAAELQERRIATGFARNGSLRVAFSEAELQEIRQSVALLAGDGWKAELLDRADLPERLRDAYAGASYHPLDAEIQPARFVRGIAALASAAGARFYDHSPVIAIAEDAHGVEVTTPEGAVTAATLALATNAWLGESGALLDANWLSYVIAPTRGQMLTTAPVADLGLSCPCYADEGYQYWRQLPDGRLAVGGWRNQAMANEVGLDETPNEAIQPHLERFVRETLALPDARIEHRWAGIMAFSSDGLPLVGRSPDHERIYLAGGYTGHGNAYAISAARVLTALIQGGTHPDADLFDPARFAQSL